MNKSENKYFNTSIRFDKALLSLLEKKPLEYITIREICETARVNRSTFYLHYESLSDLLKEATAYMLEDFASYFPNDQKKMIENYINCDLQELNYIKDEYLYPYLSYIKENKRVFSAVLSQPSTFDSPAIFQRLFENIFNPILERFQYPPEERRYVMIFYLNGITAIITEWLRNNCDQEQSEIIAIIRHCIFGKDLVLAQIPEEPNRTQTPPQRKT